MTNALTPSLFRTVKEALEHIVLILERGERVPYWVITGARAVVDATHDTPRPRSITEGGTWIYDCSNCRTSHDANTGCPNTPRFKTDDYTGDISTGWVHRICGSIVRDRAVHDQWHYDTERPF